MTFFQAVIYWAKNQTPKIKAGKLYGFFGRRQKQPDDGDHKINQEYQ